MTSFDPTAYGRDIADLYDDLYPSGGPDIAAAVATIAAASPRDPVLELGIGTGRMAFPLRDAGLDVHGVEISPEMVAQLTGRDPEGTLTVHLADMTTFDLGTTYGAVVCFADGLYALPTQDLQAQCLVRSAAHLGPGARLFLETTWPGVVQKQPTGVPAGVKHLGADSLWLTTAYHKPLSQVSLYVHSLIGGGQVRTVRELFRAVWPSELDLMARLAGLRLVERWQDWTGTPVGEDPVRVISVYQREPPA